MNIRNGIGFLGDVHGDIPATLKALDAFHSRGIDTILQLGDFGIGWDDKFERKVTERLTRNNQILLVTLGNHENYDRIERLEKAGDPVSGAVLPDETNNWDDWIVRTHRILLAPRGARWEWEGVSFVSLGGANSIDKAFRTEYRSWWRQEQISMGDVYRTIDGGVADIMLAHDAPDGVDHLQVVDDGYWNEDALHYAGQSRTMMKHATDVVQPKMFFHGHYHRFIDQTVQLQTDEGELYRQPTRVVTMNMNGEPDYMGVLQLPSMEFEPIR